MIDTIFFQEGIAKYSKASEMRVDDVSAATKEITVKWIKS